jgi:hypothetical protein
VEISSVNSIHFISRPGAAAKNATMYSCHRSSFPLTYSNLPSNLGKLTWAIACDANFEFDTKSGNVEM